MARNRKRKTGGGGELDGLADDRLLLHRPPSRPNTGVMIATCESTTSAQSLELFRYVIE
jgi:hypothetical protein